MTSFAELATVSASTKRSPAASGVKVGAAAENLTGLSCTPLDPVDPELRQKLQLKTSFRLYETFIDGSHDIKLGDWLVVGDDEYPIRVVEDWTWRGSAYLHLIVEEKKAA